MNPRTLVNLSLLIAVVVLSVLVFTGSKDKSVKPVKKLSSLKAADITRVTIKQKDKPAIQLAKSKGHWYIKKPLDLPANGARIKSFLGIVESRSDAQYQVKQQALTKYGLEYPEVEITLNELKISLGSTDPIRRYRYALIGNDVHLFIDRFGHLIKGKPTDFVSNALLPVEKSITSIKLPELAIEQKEGQWRLTPASNESLSQDGVIALIDEWRYAQALQVSPYKAASDSSKHAITIGLGGRQQPIRFTIVSNDDDEFILARPDWKIKYHFTTSAADTLMKLPPPVTEP